MRHLLFTILTNIAICTIEAVGSRIKYLKIALLPFVRPNGMATKPLNVM